MLNCVVIGAGRLGKNIALALMHAKKVVLTAVQNQSPASTNQAWHALCPLNNPSAQALAQADVIWITTNDDAIVSVAQTLAKQQLKPSVFIIHCSGVLNSSVLRSLQRQGYQAASFHPLKSFPTGYMSTCAFQGVYCVVEGDALVSSWLKTVFSQLGAQICTIHPQAKVTYHAAATMASNYLGTLALCGEQLLIESGLTAIDAKNMIHHLMAGTLDNLHASRATKDALTGPISRGDASTVALHVTQLTTPYIKNLYTAAGIATLALNPSSPAQQLIQTYLKQPHD